MLPTLQTARLRLRPRTRADLEANLAMDLDPAVVRFIYGTPPDPEEQRSKLITMIDRGWPARGGIWVVEWRDDPGLLGWCGLFPLDGAEDQIEIGYRYTRAAWGQGIATEAGAGVRDWGFDVMKLDRQCAVTHPDNRDSQHVLAKLGFVHRGSGRHYGRELSIFRLTKSAWRARAAKD